MRYLKRISNERELKCETLLYKTFMFKFTSNSYDTELFCMLYLLQPISAENFLQCCHKHLLIKL